MYSENSFDLLERSARKGPKNAQGSMDQTLGIIDIDIGA